METRVSRKDLFEAGEASSPELEPVVALDFEEVEVDRNGAAEPEDAEVGAFQLFGGHTMTIDLEAADEVIVQSRPDSYYFAVSGADRERCMLVALTGEQVLAQAAAELARAAQRPAAPDINADWVKPRRKCRPGKAARAQRKERNVRLDRERKEQRFAYRRGGFRPRRGR